MPRMMIAFQPLEFVIAPDTTYILINSNDHFRRIFTDGRDWPKEIVPTYQGYSIGRWIDEDNNGRYDALEVETRGPFKGPRAYDASGLPLHFDNQSIFKERIYRDKADKNILHDQITVKLRCDSPPRSACPGFKFRAWKFRLRAGSFQHAPMELSFVVWRGSAPNNLRARERSWSNLVKLQ
jgi:hypothetical protein